MRKILSLALLISLGMGNIGTVIAAEKTPVLNAGAEEVKVDGTKPETKKKKETKIKPTKNKYDYINMSWWGQFNDDNLNAYIIKAMDKNQDLKMATLTIDEYYQASDCISRISSGIRQVHRAFSRRVWIAYNCKL